MPVGHGTYTTSTLAHELQHAMEIAQQPAIVDEDSLAREYARIGFTNASRPPGTTFDTDAAIHVGTQVLRELRDAPDGRGIDVSGE